MEPIDLLNQKEEIVKPETLSGGHQDEPFPQRKDEE